MTLAGTEHRTGTHRAPRHVATRRRHAAALGLALGGVTLVGSGVFSAWSVTSGVTTGALTAAASAVAMVDANGGTFSTPVPDLLPGDYFYRYVDLRNTSGTTGAYAGNVAATGDLAAVLSVQVDSCPQPWATDHTCAGTSVPITVQTPASSPVATDYGQIAPGDAGRKHVRYKFTFSADAPATAMGKSGTVTANVVGTVMGNRNRTTG